MQTFSSSEKIHFDQEGKYYCNFHCHSYNPKKLTKDKEKITCRNCINALERVDSFKMTKQLKKKIKNLGRPGVPFSEEEIVALRRIVDGLPEDHIY